VQPLGKLPQMYIILIEPGVEVPEKKTAWMYKNYDSIQSPTHGNINNIIDAVGKKDTFLIAKSIFNAFEQVNVPEYKISKELIQQLKEEGCINATLCGSGPTVFGISDDPEKLKSIAAKIKYKSIITSIEDVYQDE